jgi:hypothetical protein
MLRAQHRPFLPIAAAIALLAAPAAAQEMQPHRAAYDVTVLDHGKPGADSAGSYAFELKLTCDSYAITQRMRLTVDGGRNSVVSEELSQMTESRDGRKLHFEHHSTANGRQVSQFKGDATLDDSGMGEARFSDPEGQSVALPAGTMFPIAITRATVRHAKAGDTNFDGLFFYGEKPKPPQAVNILIGKVPKRLDDLKMPTGSDALTKGHARIYYRGGFFDSDAKAKGESPLFEMSSLTLDNGIELYGTHEEGDSGIEYRISRLETLPKPNCN